MIFLFKNTIHLEYFNDRINHVKESGEGLDLDNQNQQFAKNVFFINKSNKKFRVGDFGIKNSGTVG